MQMPIAGTLINGPSGPLSLELGEPLGAGAFGVVFKAHAVNGSGFFAVKFPQAALFGKASEFLDFQNEVRASSEISHPNIVRILHVEPNPDGLPPYLVMEYLDGGTLRSALKQLREAHQQLGWEQLRLWIGGLLRGIAAINEKILHRDLRPENILLEGNTPKITDFGLSKIVGALTRANSFKGQQHALYMAPEAWLGEANTVQLDMYAMGIVLFEIAALEYPYELPADIFDDVGVRNAHLFLTPTPLEKRRPDLPIELSHIVVRLLEKRSIDRFQKWSDVLARFEAISPVCSAPTTERDKAVTELLSRMLKQHEEQSRQRLTQEAKKVTNNEMRAIDRFQAEKLLLTISTAVEGLNARSSLPPIRFVQGGLVLDGFPPDAMQTFLRAIDNEPTGRLRYRPNDSRHEDFYLLKVTPPGGRSIEIRLFCIKPPLKLKDHGSARLVCFIWNRGTVYFSSEEEQLRCTQVPSGYSLVLARTDEADIYGRWGFLALENHPYVTVNWCYDPDKSWLLNDENRIVDEIERPRDGGYKYTLTFEDDLGAALLRLI